MLHKIFLYDCETHQMPEIIKQKALQLEPVLGSYGVCKLSHTFPMEKPFNYSHLKLTSEHMLECEHTIDTSTFHITTTCVGLLTKF